MGPHRIFIAGAYGDYTPLGNRQGNVERLDEVTKQIMLKGHIPYNPVGQMRYFDDDARLTKKQFVAVSDDMLSLCDALMYVCGSPGADREYEIAKEQGKIIYYSIDEISYAD